MLDQNTDRMWYVIGAVIVGAALIFIMNRTMPELFASVAGTFDTTVDETTEYINTTSSAPYGVNILIDSNRHVQNTNYLIATYQLAYTDLMPGDEVTITMKGTLNPEKIAFGFYNSGGHGSDRVVSLGHSDFNAEGIAQKTFTWRIRTDTTSNDRLHVYMLNNVLHGGVDHVMNEIEWVRLERGPGQVVR